MKKNTALTTILLSLQILTISKGWAQDVATPAAAPSTSTEQAAPKSPVELDLSSTVANMSAPAMLGDKTVNINVGGADKAVTSASVLTPAERLAVYQVLSSATQSIVLGTQGNAVAGTFNIGPRFSQYVSGLVIPQGVTALKDATNSSTLNLAGNLVNAGSIFVYSTNGSTSAASIAASAINNQVGGLISTVAPTAMLPGVANLNSSLNLQLTSLTNIINSGSIISSGSLGLTAGGAIINALPQGSTAAQPVMQAVNGINLISGAGAIYNTGLISSLAGNININSIVSQNISINNITGTLQALNGTINVRDIAFGDKKNLTVTGGDILSKELNLFTGEGTLIADANSITGQVNAHAGYAELGSVSGNLNLGNITITGDPTFYSLGDMVLTGDLIYPGEPLNLYAQGSITLKGGRISAGPVNIFAGYQVNVFESNFDPLSNGVSEPPFALTPQEGGSVEQYNISNSGRKYLYALPSSVTATQNGNVNLDSTSISASQLNIRATGDVVTGDIYANKAIEIVSERNIKTGQLESATDLVSLKAGANGRSGKISIESEGDLNFNTHGTLYGYLYRLEATDGIFLSSRSGNINIAGVINAFGSDLTLSTLTEGKAINVIGYNYLNAPLVAAGEILTNPYLLNGSSGGDININTSLLHFVDAAKIRSASNEVGKGNLVINTQEIRSEGLDYQIPWLQASGKVDYLNPLTGSVCVSDDSKLTVVAPGTLKITTPEKSAMLFASSKISISSAPEQAVIFNGTVMLDNAQAPSYRNQVYSVGSASINAPGESGRISVTGYLTTNGDISFSTSSLSVAKNSYITLGGVSLLSDYAPGGSKMEITSPNGQSLNIANAGTIQVLEQHAPQWDMSQYTQTPHGSLKVESGSALTVSGEGKMVASDVKLEAQNNKLLHFTGGQTFDAPSSLQLNAAGTVGRVIVDNGAELSLPALTVVKTTSVENNGKLTSEALDSTILVKSPAGSGLLMNGVGTYGAKGCNCFVASNGNLSFIGGGLFEGPTSLMAVGNNGSVLLRHSIQTNGSDLAVLASKDIISFGSGIELNTSSTKSNGGNITLAAGVQLAGQYPSAVLGASATGGSVDIRSQGAVTKIDTSSSAGNGGNVTLIAANGNVETREPLFAIPGETTFGTAMRLVVNTVGSNDGNSGSYTRILSKDASEVASTSVCALGQFAPAASIQASATSSVEASDKAAITIKLPSTGENQATSNNPILSNTTSTVSSSSNTKQSAGASATKPNSFFTPQTSLTAKFPSQVAGETDGGSFSMSNLLSFGGKDSGAEFGTLDTNFIAYATDASANFNELSGLAGAEPLYGGPEGDAPSGNIEGYDGSIEIARETATRVETSVINKYAKSTVYKDASGNILFKEIIKERNGVLEIEQLVYNPITGHLLADRYVNKSTGVVSVLLYNNLGSVTNQVEKKNDIVKVYECDPVIGTKTFTRSEITDDGARQAVLDEVNQIDFRAPQTSSKTGFNLNQNSDIAFGANPERSTLQSPLTTNNSGSKINLDDSWMKLDPQTEKLMNNSGWGSLSGMTRLQVERNADGTVKMFPTLDDAIEGRVLQEDQMLNNLSK